VCIDGQRGRIDFMTFLSFLELVSLGRLHTYTYDAHSALAEAGLDIDDFDDKLMRMMGHIISTVMAFPIVLLTLHIGL
jgi:hypothetical protein